MRFPVVFVLSLLGSLAFAAEVAPDPAAEEMTISLPSSSELPRLTDLVSEFVGVSIQYNPQKISGTVRLTVREKLDKPSLWKIYNQVLLGQGFTTVAAGNPPVYHVVPINEAPALSSSIASAALTTMELAPGYAVIVHPLEHLSAANAVKSLGALFSAQTSQVRTLGDSDRSIVIAAPTERIRDALRLLASLDRPGITPELRMYAPQRAAPAALQAATASAWASFTRVDGNPRIAEIQVAPDGRQLILIASSTDVEAIARLAASIDSSEPIESRTYRPRFFGIDEVAALLQQLLKSGPGGGAGIDIVRDPLTNSLVVTATSAQHERVATLMTTLDEAPAGSRRQVRTYAVKHRQADEVAKVLASLIASGVVGASATDTTPQPVPAPGEIPPPPPTPAPPAVAAVGGNQPQGDIPVIITTDTVTNRLVCLGDPRALDQIEGLLAQLDKRQPQVDLEVVLVTLSSSQSRDLGVELAGQVTRGEVTYTATSLFGLSTAPAGAPLSRQLGNPAGLGGLVINPGDYAAVIRALETVTNGNSFIRSKVVVNNNAKATVNGVLQQPLTSINSGEQVATTTYAGTTDAGTQLTIQPQISPADYITLTYTVSQSTFLGESTVTANGGVIPPTKRTDSVSSVATVPDGFVIGLGGLSNQTRNVSETRLPFLGGIPVLGYLFKSEAKTDADSRFFVFIRANVLRHESFADLRRSSMLAAEAAPGMDRDPTLEPQLMR